MIEQLRYGFEKTEAGKRRPFVDVPPAVSTRIAHHHEAQQALERLVRPRYGVLEVVNQRQYLKFDQFKRWKDAQDAPLKKFAQKSLTMYLTGLHALSTETQKDPFLTITASSLPVSRGHYGMQALLRVPAEYDFDQAAVNATRQMQLVSEQLDLNPDSRLTPNVKTSARRGIELTMNGGIIGALVTERTITHPDGSATLVMKGEHFKDQTQQIVSAIGLIALAHPADLA